MNKARTKYEIIEEMKSKEENEISIKEMCKIAGVSRSGYYNWKATKEKREEREKRDQKDFEKILKAYKYRGYDKGIRGIHMRLLHEEEPVLMNVKKIKRLMRKYDLKCPIRKANQYRRMAKAMKTNKVSENILNREFKEHGARKVLLTDITYIPIKENKSYLSVIIDAYTKQVLSYVLSETLEVDFVLETVEKLIKEHGITLDKETIIHSDQGCHYTSKKFRTLIKEKELRQSMSRKGNCWDNAPQESFFGHMKEEIGSKIKNSNTYEEVKEIIEDWMDYYNNDRYQWNLAKLSPNEYYKYIKEGKYPLKRYEDNKKE